MGKHEEKLRTTTGTADWNDFDSQHKRASDELYKWPPISRFRETRSLIDQEEQQPSKSVYIDYRWTLLSFIGFQ